MDFYLFNAIPKPYRLTAKDWRDGMDVVSMLPRSTYRRHRAALRRYGIDIGQPCERLAGWCGWRSHGE